MGDSFQNMEGGCQHIRPSRQSNNSPTPLGNSPRSLAKSRNSGQLKSPKYVKGNAPNNGPKNFQSNQSRSKGNRHPQKKSSFPDKCPPAKGLKQTGRFDPLAVENGELHWDSDFRVTPRKDPTSLNHLLNFTFAPRQQAHHAWTNKKKAGGRWNYFNKEQFLQANCQFVVKMEGDYVLNTIDPDVIVDWQLIEQVRVKCREMPSCPICLYPPTAAQITRCGHIYCWSCILHYLSLSGKSWRKCPICYESVHKKDLKSVMAVSERTHSLGQEITMTLMKRAKDSVIALPKTKWFEGISIPRLASDEVDKQFSKLLIASPGEILNQVIAKDRSELNSQLIEVESDQSEEKPFVELAIEECKEREEELIKVCGKNPKVTLSVPDQSYFTKPEAETGDVADENLRCGVLYNGTGLQTSEEDEHCCTSVSSDDSTCSLQAPDSSQCYYFYQAEDGQNIFLHPVNARCLTKEYGSLESCPQSISGQIIEVECYTQTEELRRRFRYLRHLPLTCEFAVCELVLTPPVVSRETLNHFKDDLRKRCVQRQKKAKEEAKHEKKCKSKVSTFAGMKEPSIPVAIETPNLDSEQDFPQQVGSNHNVWIASSPPMSGAWAVAGAADDDSPPAVPSFAKALSDGKPTPRQPLVKARTYSEGSRNDDEKCSDDEEIDNECGPVPSFQSAFTDALMFADMSLSVEPVSEENRNRGNRRRKNKQKRGDKKLLFSTGSVMKL